MRPRSENGLHFVAISYALEWSGRANLFICNSDEVRVLVVWSLEPVYDARRPSTHLEHGYCLFYT